MIPTCFPSFFPLSCYPPPPLPPPPLSLPPFLLLSPFHCCTFISCSPTLSGTLSTAVPSHSYSPSTTVSTSSHSFCVLPSVSISIHLLCFIVPLIPHNSIPSAVPPLFTSYAFLSSSSTSTSFCGLIFKVHFMYSRPSFLPFLPPLRALRTQEALKKGYALAIPGSWQERHDTSTGSYFCYWGQVMQGG